MTAVGFGGCADLSDTAGSLVLVTALVLMLLEGGLLFGPSEWSDRPYNEQHNGMSVACKGHRRASQVQGVRSHLHDTSGSIVPGTSQKLMAPL